MTTEEQSLIINDLLAIALADRKAANGFLRGGKVTRQMQGLSLPALPLPISLPIFFSPEGNDASVNDSLRSPDSRDDKGRQVRVLVVDDAPDVLEMFAMMLKLSGYDVTVAASALQALEQAHATQFDLIVSDIGMPEINGYELAQRLRALPTYRSVPMIAVTGFSRFNDHGQSLESGFNAHLTKPVSPTTLLNLIEQLTE